MGYLGNFFSDYKKNPCEHNWCINYRKGSELWQDFYKHQPGSSQKVMNERERWAG